MLKKQFYPKWDVFRKSPKVTIYLGYFCNKNFTQNLKKSPNLVALALQI